MQIIMLLQGIIITRKALIDNLDVIQGEDINKKSALEGCKFPYQLHPIALQELMCILCAVPHDMN